jgi:hypothetical protein
MNYNEYLFTQLAEEILNGYLNEHYYEYDSRFPVIEKLYKYFKLTDNGDGDLYARMEEFLMEREDEIKKHGCVKLNKIKKEAFLNWFFDDFDGKDWLIDYAYEKLLTKGELYVMLNDIIELTSYIPGHLCEIKLDAVEYDPKEVIFI